MRSTTVYMLLAFKGHPPGCVLELDAREHPVAGLDAIDAITQEWRQGDFLLGTEWFVIRGDPSTHSRVPDPGEIIEEDVLGLVVVTQTCDIVRSCTTRPFVEVSPIVKVSNEALHDIRAGRRPGYAFIPALAGDALVADLERTMTVTKNLLASWTRVSGCETDDEIRAFSRCLQRKRGRFAFPDDFNAMATKLLKRLREKHDRQTKEGEALRRLREIRVTAYPSWDAQKVELFFWFIRSRDDVCPEWHSHLNFWLTLLSPSGRFEVIDGQVASLDEMTAADYVGSDVLDLDHLSTGSPSQVNQSNG